MRIKVFVRLGIVLSVLMLAVLVVPQPQVALAEKKFNLVFQATWPAGLTLFDNFKWVAKRLDEMTGGKLKIKTLPAGAIVPAFELLDATSKGVVDGAHAKVMTGGDLTKFGILLQDVDEVKRIVDEFELKVVGLHEHTGSGLQLTESVYQSMKNIQVIAGDMITPGKALLFLYVHTSQIPWSPVLWHRPLSKRTK